MAKQKLEFDALLTLIQSGLGTQTTAFAPTYESFTTLLDKIGATITIDSDFTDGLAIFDDRHLEYGATVEEFVTEMLEVHDYNPSLNPFDDAEVDDIDVKRAYHYRSKDKTILLKMRNNVMKRAFKGPETYSMFTAQQLKRIEDTKTIYKYEAKKVALKEYLSTVLDYNEVTLATLLAEDKDEQHIDEYALVKDVLKPVDKATGEVFIKAIQDIVKDFSISAKRKYNPFGLVQQSSKENIILMIEQGLMSSLNVYNYANAFHKELLGLGISVIEVDKDTLDAWKNVTVDETTTYTQLTETYALLTDKRLIRYMTTMNDSGIDINKAGGFSVYSRHFGENTVISKAIPLVAFGVEKA